MKDKDGNEIVSKNPKNIVEPYNPSKKSLRGRPTKYTEELASNFCERMINGESVRTICKADDMPVPSTIFLWMAKHPGFSEQYDRAKALAVQAIADDILEIADNQVTNTIIVDGKEQTVKDSVGVAHAKLRVDTRKWLLSKIAPNKYGDKLQTSNLNINVEYSNMSDEDLDRAIDVLEPGSDSVIDDSIT